MAFELRPILKTYYDALEEGKILGMKCEECGDVTFPPLPTCQKCGSYHMDWIEMGPTVVLDEIRFEDSSVGGDYTFRKGNPLFEKSFDVEPYCVSVAHFVNGTHQFHAALFGVTEENKDRLIDALPFEVDVKYIQLKKDFKSVGLQIKAADRS
jgi:uncharacterized OB-fold protein